jgi:hypothetical protein
MDTFLVATLFAIIANICFSWILQKRRGEES